MTMTGPKQFEYVCANDMRADNPLNLGLTEMWDRIERGTNGVLSVRVMPWGTAGPSKESLAKLIDGCIAFHPVSGMPPSTRVPIAAMEGLPYACRTEEDAFRVLDGEFGTLLRRERIKGE